MFYRNILFVLLLSALMSSCARVGTLDGGPKDVTPPVFIGSIPDTLSTNVNPKTKKIELNFDEYVVLKEPSRQIIVSPPPKINPSYLPNSKGSKTVTVKFNEDLQENTTYTINFGTSIQDNNEGNKLPFFSYTFSTGNKIDSLQILGKTKESLTSAHDKNTLVALFKLKAGDTLDIKNKPYYISRIDTAGRYNLNHLKSGRYRLIAFNDKSSDLIPQTEKENVGFISDIIDLKQNEQRDLVIAPAKNKYRVVSTDQDGQGVIKVKFAGNPQKVKITSLTEKLPPINIYHKEYADSLYVYFNTKKLDKDTKKLNVKLLAEYQEKTDTLKCYYDNSAETKLSFSPGNTDFVPNDVFILKAANYIKNIDKSAFSVTKNKEALDFSAEINPVNPKEVLIKFPVLLATKYRVKVKEKGITDFLDNSSDSLSYDISTKKISDYGNLYLKLQNKPAHKFFLQLLTEKYELIKEIYGNEGSFNFQYMKPGKYLLRILVDENENGVWDKADLDTFTQPEKTYLYGKPIEIRAFWDMNETWILN